MLDSMLHLLYWMMTLVPWTQGAGAPATKKGHLAGFQVTFFYAYGVSCRARVEEADPTARCRLAPLIGSPAAGCDLLTPALGDLFYDLIAAESTTGRGVRQVWMLLRTESDLNLLCWSVALRIRGRGWDYCANCASAPLCGCVPVVRK